MKAVPSLSVTQHFSHVIQRTEMISWCSFSKSLEMHFKYDLSNSVRRKTKTQKSESLTDTLPDVQHLRYKHQKIHMAFCQVVCICTESLQVSSARLEVIPTGLQYLGSNFNSSANKVFAIGSGHATLQPETDCQMLLSLL